MVTSEVVSMEELFSQYAAETAIQEASRFATVATDKYPIQITKAEGRKYPERTVAHFQADVLSTDGSNKKRATVFFDASWIEKRTEKGDQDRHFRLWNQISRAVYPELTDTQRAAKSVAETMEMASKYPLLAYITESYEVPDAKGPGRSGWLTPKNDEERARFKSAGYKARNLVQSVSKYV